VVRRRIQLGGLVFAVSVLALAPTATAKSDLTIAPADTPGVSNCYPFGTVLGDGGWIPNFAFFYADIPAFKVQRGDRIAFDLGARNDDDPSGDIQFDIALARMEMNGGLEEAQPYRRVVTNDVKPTNPRGDTTIGNFELGYKVQAKFKFRGGGLGIRFSNPSDAYMADDTCDDVLVVTTAADASGFFVARAGTDPNGVFPWTGFVDNGELGGFRIQFAPQTKIKKGPKGETDDPDAAFRFKSSDRGSKFKCKLDKGRFKRCKKRKRFEGLDLGKHVLKVKAKDRDGLVDLTPAKRKWTVLP
jgi:hypothetical protein